MSGSLDEIRAKYGLGPSKSGEKEKTPVSNNSRKSETGTSLDEIRAKYGIGPAKSSDRVDGFNQGAQKYNYVMDAFGRWYDQSMSGLSDMGRDDIDIGSTNQEAATWMNRAGELRQWANANKDTLGDNYQGIMDSLQQMTNAAYWMDRGYKNQADDLLTNFETIEEYDQYQADKAHREEMDSFDMDAALWGQYTAWNELDAMRSAYNDLYDLEGPYGLLANDAAPEEERQRNQARYDEIVGMYGEGITAEALFAQLQEKESQYKQMGTQIDEVSAYRDSKIGSSTPWQETPKKTAQDYRNELDELNASIEALSNYIDTLDARYEELDRAIAIYSSSSDPEAIGMLATAQNELDMLLAQRNDANQEYDAAMSQKWQLERNLKYDTLGENADYSKMSGYSVTNADDQLYRYINNRNGMTTFLQPGEKYNQDATFMNDNPDYIFGFMSDEQVANYNYIYATQGKEAADAYLEYLRPQMDAEKTGFLTGEMQSLTQDSIGGAIVANALRVPLNLASGIGYFDIAAQNMARDIRGDYAPINYNSAAMLPTHLSRTVRQTTAGMITDATGTIQLDPNNNPFWAKILNGRGLADVYQLGMSAVDSRVAAAVTKNPAAATALLASSAATNGILDALERGATDEEALQMGLWNGIAEAAFEFFEVDNLLKGDPNWIKATVNQALTEGIGEGLTTVANNVSDFLIMADKSEVMQKIAEYKSEGMSEKQALWNALGDIAIDMGWDFLGGASSGGISAAGMSAVQNATNTWNTGKAVRQDQMVDPLMQLANQMAGLGEYHGKVEKYAQKATQRPSAYNVGRLYNETNRVIDQQNMDQLAQALQAQGMTKSEATKLASAIALDLNGIELTRAQERLLEKHEGNYSVAKAIFQVLGSDAYMNRANALDKLHGKTTTKAQEAPSQAKTEEKTEVNQAKVETTHTISEDGKTHLKAEPEKAVTIDSVEAIEDGKMTLRLNDGSTVDADDVIFGNDGDALIYEVLSDMNVSVENANTIVQQFKDTNIPAQEFALDIQDAYQYGRYNQGLKESNNSPAAQLAWNEGRMAAIAESSAQQEQVEQAYQKATEVLKQTDKKRGEYHASLEEGIEVTSLAETQKASYELADRVAQAAKTDISVYDGKTGEWGFYEPKTDTIHLNLNATNKSRKSMMAFVLGHELVHRAKAGSPKKFQAFADFLVDEYGKNGVPLDDLIEEQILAAKEHGIEMSRDEAFDEVVCDSCQRMLLDTDAGKKLAMFGAESKQNHSFLEDLKRWITEFIDKLRSLFVDVDPDSIAAQEFAKFDDGVKQILADMFVDMTMEAGEHLSAIKEALGTDALIELNNSGEFTMAQNADGSEKGIKLSDKDKKLDAAGKEKLKQLQKDGARMKLPVADAREKRIADTQAKVTSRYKKAVDQVLAGTYNSRDNLIMGYTPEIFTRLGMPSLPFVIGPGHVYTATVTEAEAQADPLNRYISGGHYHGLGVNAVKKLYSAIQDPVMIIASKDTGGRNSVPRSLHSVVAIVDVGDATKHLLLPVELTATRIVEGNRMNVNVLSSSYMRSVDNLVAEAIAQMNIGDVGVYYAKKEAIALLSGRVSFPKQLTEAIASDGIVHRFPEKVNMAIDSSTKSIQFLKWFGDWLNDLEHSSKVVNDDGTPMIVYHGSSSGNIKTFRTSNVMGTGGLYLSTSQAVARGFAGANGEVYASYVNMRNPLIVDADYAYYDSIAIPSEMVGHKYASGRTVDTNAIAAFAREAGYDGVIVKNVREPSGYGDDIIAFSPSQVKSVDNIGTFDPEKNNSMYKLPVGADTSPRALLANAFESVAQTDIEKSNLEKYRSKLADLEEMEAKLSELKAQIKELSFAEGKRDKEKINKLKFEANATANRIETLDKILVRFEASEPIRKIIEREKEKVRVRTKEKVSEAAKNRRERERESMQKRDARAKLDKLVLDTVSWIRAPKKGAAKCPDILKKPYMDFLNGIDTSSQRMAKGGDPTKADLRMANALGALTDTIEKITMGQDPSKESTDVFDSGYLDLPADFVKQLRDMTEKIRGMMENGGYVINSMTAQEVKDLAKHIRTLNHAIREMGTLYANKRFENAKALGKDSMHFMDALGETDGTSSVKDFVQWQNALPYYAFKRFGLGGESVFEGLMDAQDKLAFLAEQIFNFQKKTWTGDEADAWSKDVHTVELENDMTEDGKVIPRSIRLTTADAMSIYCLYQREQGRKHLFGGGVRVIGIEQKGKKAPDSITHLTENDVELIIKSLSDRQIKVATAIQRFMSDVCAEWGNEISMKRFLTREFPERNYFPIESDDVNMTKKDPSAQQSDLFRLLNISATKGIDPNANNRAIVRNIFDVFSGHAADMARLNAFALPLLDYMKWLNYREKTVTENGHVINHGIRESMLRAYGEAAERYVTNLIKDVNGRPSDGGIPSFYSRMLKNAKTAMVGSSLRVATLQVTSYPRAALVLSTKSLVLGLHKLPNIKMAQKYCGIALWKSFGFYDTNISRTIEEQMKGVKDVRQKMIELSLKGAEIGDALTWGVLWNACEYEVAATNKYETGTEEFYKAVGEKLREVVYATQVVDSILTRSETMRSKDSKMKEMSSFMSEPTLSANILMDAGFQFNMEKRRNGGGKAGAKEAWKVTGKYVGRAIAVYSIGQLAAALMEGLWDAWRDDDDEEFWKKYLKAFVENLILDIIPFNKIPILSDIAEAALSLFGLGIFSSDNLSSTALSQTVASFKAWADVLNGKSSATVYNALYKTMRAVSSVLGVSISGVMREGVDLWNNTAGAFDNTLKIRTYESADNRSDKLFKALKNGDQKYLDKFMSSYSDEDKGQAAIRAEVKARYLAGEISESEARNYLTKYGGLDITEAYWKMKEWDFDKEDTTGEDFAKYDRFYEAVKTGANLKAVIKEYTDNGVEPETLRRQITEYFNPLYVDMSASERASIKGYLLNAMVACGQDREKAEMTLMKWDFEAGYGYTWDDRGDAYRNGAISASKLVDELMAISGKTREEAELQVEVYDWQKDIPNCDITAAGIRDYHENCEGVGISRKVYYDAWRNYQDTSGEIDEDTGESIPYSKVQKVMPYINGLDLTPAQKTALALCWWGASTVNKYKLW